MCVACSDGNEGFLFHRCGKSVEYFVHLWPALQFLRVVQPALDVRVLVEIAPDDLAERDERRLIGDSDPIVAQILLLRPDSVIIEDLKPSLGALLAPRDGPVLHNRCRFRE